MKNSKSTIFALVITLITTFGGYYLILPAANICDMECWIFIIFQICIYCIFKNVGNLIFYPKKKQHEVKPKVMTKRGLRLKNPVGIPWKSLTFLVPVIAVVIFVILSIGSSKMFNAGRYSEILKVNEEADFNEDIATAVNTEAIALMDTDSAKMLGDREIGSLSKVVSQYDVSDDYTQIDYNGKPVKVASLEYAGFFKWINNKDVGVPGYVTVDPVSMSAEYHECENMMYVPSAFFGQDLYRYVRSHYRTEMFGDYNFEIDESGNPYYIFPAYKKTIGLFGGKTVKGAVIVNPCNGELTYYDVKDVPVWADVVYDGNLICEQYNWYGKLKNGFVNSLFGKKGCKKVTEYRTTDDDDDDEDVVPANDYGYIAKDGDIWIYTGVTSVNKDSSNVGFLLANERTGEARYYSISGADEASAMSAAEGEVQEKGYQASFPSLINVNGIPTYIMVLKDNSGLVKLYAAVNVEQYNIVATASTQEACIEKYQSLVSSEIVEPEDDTEPTEKSITIADLKLIDREGDTYLYIITTEQEIYHTGAVASDDNEKALLLKNGDTITIYCKGSLIETWEY